jgi:hypothetical protein
VTATIYRLIGTDRTAVRAASAVDVSVAVGAAAGGCRAALRGASVLRGGPDGRQRRRVDGDQRPARSLRPSAAMSSPMRCRAVGAAVNLEASAGRRRGTGTQRFNVGGRMVVCQPAPVRGLGTVTVRTESDADGDALGSRAAGRNRGCRTDPQAGQPSRGWTGTTRSLSDTERPHWYDELRWWSPGPPSRPRRGRTAWRPGLHAAGPGERLCDAAGPRQRFPGRHAPDHRPVRLSGRDAMLDMSAAALSVVQRSFTMEMRASSLAGRPAAGRRHPHRGRHGDPGPVPGDTRADQPHRAAPRPRFFVGADHCRSPARRLRPAACTSGTESIWAASFEWINRGVFLVTEAPKRPTTRCRSHAKGCSPSSMRRSSPGRSSRPGHWPRPAGTWSSPR